MMRITTKPAILGHTINKPQHSIEQPQSEYQGTTSYSQVRVEATLPRVTIDQTAAFSDSGRKNIEDFLSDNINYGKQVHSAAVGRTAAQGSALQDIHKGGYPIISNAIQNSIDQFINEFGMVTMPRSRPKIDVIEGQLDIQVADGQINGSFTQNQPIINYKAGNIERYMEQYNSINIEYLGEDVDLQV